MDSNLVLKVTFEQIKLKVVLQADLNLIKDLKTYICEQLIKAGVSKIDSSLINLQNQEGQTLNEDDKILDKLQTNDQVIVLKKEELQQNQLQEQPQIVQEQQIEQQTNDPEEAIVVLYDTSGSMGCSYFEDRELSRMGAVNAYFSAFADKTLAFEFNHIVKLVCFENRVQDKCEFINDFNKFIQLVDNANPGGGTNCYDAIGYAIDKLVEVKQKYPNIVLRIIALTDGEDTGSKERPETLVKRIFEHKIIMDSFVVGNNCVGLKTLTHASNGRCYCPTDLGQGMQLFEIESILSTSKREKVEYPNQVVDLETIKNRPFDTEGMKVVQVDVKNKAVLRRDEIVRRAKEAQDLDDQQAVNTTSATKNPAPSNAGAERRILKELNEYIAKGVQTDYRIYPTTDNIKLWKIYIYGPRGTPYEHGIYQLVCQIPNDYPFKPPKFNFVTQMYHPNISRASGAICLDVLKDKWSPALTIIKAIMSILSLLTDPNPDDALDSQVAAEYKHDKNLFIENVQKSKQAHANPTNEEILQEVLAAVDKNSQEYQDAEKELKEWIEYAKVN